jgi:glycosyltransferase involved in cell wall biosynthesis/SAM-dependent methyltransferase
MKILCGATYYHPYISGLSVLARTIAEHLAGRGHTITVLTSQYEKELPLNEVIGGVNVVRVPSLGRISKGPIMPKYLQQARRLIRLHDVAFLHLPATPLEMIAFSSPFRRIAPIPLVVLYHCDLQLPPTLWHRVVNAVVASGCRWTLCGAERILISSNDYLRQSNILRKFSGKTIAIHPPVSIPRPSATGVEVLRSRLSPTGEFLIGYVGRWAAEKGLEYLVEALPIIRDSIPAIKVVCAGSSTAVGEERYRDALNAVIAGQKVPWEVLGPMTSQEMADFYAACDVTVLPSLNATESFGLIQLESMLSGTPMVAADLPGVRVPIRTTDMGRLVPPRNAKDLADAIVDVIRNRICYVKPRQEIERQFAADLSLNRYEDVLQSLYEKHFGKDARLPASTNASAGCKAQTPVAADKPEDVLRNFLAILPPFHALVRSAEHRLLRQSAPFEEPLLDLGCGDGTFASQLFSRPITIAMDANHGNCREAGKRKAHRCVINADAVAMPFRSEYFSTVVANCVIEHIKDVDGVLSEIFRVLRPDGRLLFGVPSHRFGEMLLFPTIARRLGSNRLGSAYADWFNRRSIHIHLDPPEAWIDRLARHGFAVHRWEYYVSAAGLRAFDLAHYLSLPHLVSRKLTGRWVVFPLSLAIPVFARWLQPLASAAPEGEGPYIFFSARKTRAPINRREAAL